MNKKFGNAILMIVLLMYSGNISAMSADQQLGGFQVEMGAGENTELPWDWDEAAGNPGVQDEPQEEIWEDTEPQEEEGGETGGVSYPVQENTGNVYAPENEASGNAGISQETFWSGGEAQNTWETVMSNTPAAVPSPSLTPELSPSLLPAVTAVPSPAFPEPSALPTEIKNTEKEKTKFWKSEEAPKLLCWKGETDRNPCLRIREKREVQILYLKINGKDTKWEWQGDCIVPVQKSQQDPLVEKVVTELAVLDYGDHVHGIFIDEKNKS